MNKLFDNANTPVKKESDKLFEAIASAKNRHLKGGTETSHRNALTASHKGIVNVNKNVEKVAAEMLLMRCGY